MGPDSFRLLVSRTCLLFVLTMLAVTLPYHPKSEIFRWSQATGRPTGSFRSIWLGLAGGGASFALASPIFWLVGSRTEFIPSLIADALSPLRVLELVFFIIILAVSSELVYRGVVFRTLVDYASTPAAVLGSCMLFAFICPVLSFPSAAILGVTSRFSIPEHAISFVNHCERYFHSGWRSSDALPRPDAWLTCCAD